MYKSISTLIDRMLRMVGCKTINRQFTLSYALIFLFAAASGISLYFSMAINPQTINMAGRQRMLSQKIAKEAMLVAAQVEQISTLKKTMELFERSHQSILQGDEKLGMNAITDPEIRSQMEHVGVLWGSYKKLINEHVVSPSSQTLQALKQQSPVILKEMNKAVVLMTKKPATPIRIS